MKGLIVTGGTIDLEFAARFTADRTYDQVIAADAGLETVKRLGLKPTQVVGDLDTVRQSVVSEYLGQEGVSFEIHRPEKDETDTELALLSALRCGCREADILGALGGRMDHGLGNIQLLYYFYRRGLRASIYDPQNRIYLLEGEKRFSRRDVYGTYISFLPMTEKVEGLTLRGFKYPLEDQTVVKGTTLCISNELAEEEGIARLRTGTLICVECHD